MILNFSSWKKLYEQEMKQESLQSIPFEGSFLNNMVTIRPDNSELQKALALLDSYIQKAGGEGKTLKSLSVRVDAGSSDPRATNKLPEDVSKPDHTYNGIVPEDKWTIVNKQVQPEAITKLPPNYNPNQGYYAIQNGNKFLAQTRAENLQKYLNSYLNKKYSGAEIKINVIDVTSSKEKMVKATIDGIVFDTPNPTIEQSKWTIIYPWFKLGESNEPYAYLSNQLQEEWSNYKDLRFQRLQAASPVSGIPYKSFTQSVKNSDDEIIAAGYFKSEKMSLGVQIAFVRIEGWTGANGHTFIYDSEEKWLKEVDKLEKISNFIDKNKIYKKGIKGSATFQVRPNLEGASNITQLKPFSEKDKAIKVTQETKGINPEGIVTKSSA